MDINISILIPILIKNAGHTNQFIAEEAEKALIAGCQNCSEQLVVNSALSTSTGSRHNSIKQKGLLCCTTVIEKLGARVKGFKDLE